MFQCFTLGIGQREVTMGVGVVRRGGDGWAW